MCKKNGLIPRFSQFLNVDSDGNYVYTEGYHKFLVDFKTFDQNTGEYLPQMPVKPIFENEYLTSLLKDYVKSQESKDEHLAKTMPKVLERITNEVVGKDSDSDVLYSEGDYSYEALTSKDDMTITTLHGIVPNTRVDLVAEAKKNAAKIGKTNPKDGSVSVYVKDIAADVLLGTDGLRHGLRRAKNLPNIANAIVTLNAGEILQHSIRINEMKPSQADATKSYVMIGTARHANGDLYIVRFVVNSFELASMDVLYAINAKKESATLNASRFKAKPLSVTDSTISIAQLLDYVNTYFPGILPKPVWEHYGYTQKPNGDLGDSVLYSEQDSDKLTNRVLLANALESVAQNDIEKKRLEEYKDKLNTIYEAEKQLADIRKEANALRFKKGRTAAETQKLKSLDEEAGKSYSIFNQVFGEHMKKKNLKKR